MLWLVLIHAVATSIVLVLRRSIGRAAFLVGAVGPVAVLGWVAANAGAVIGGNPRTETLRWVPSLDLSLDFRVDGYALLFLGVIGVAGTAIFLYAARYFGSSPKVATFAATMTLFGGSMVGLVGSDHLLAVFIFWELTTITSYLLIGFDDAKAEARSAALHAALVTGAGGLAMLGGLVLLGAEAGSFSIAEIVADPPEGSAATNLAYALVLVGAITKSAQFPFHGWLPGAMAAPTPASAFLHSATMVKAGIFLAGRLAPAAADTTEWWTPVVVGVGLVTMTIGGWRALRQHDLKLMLAHGTVSQLGFLFLLVAGGDPKWAFGGLALLAGHALFKASLFMVVGTIDHEAGTRDLRRLAGLAGAMPALFGTGLAAALSMAAVPLTFGFVAKEAAFDGLLGRGVVWVAAAAAASVLTVVYTGRFLLGAFGTHVPGHEPVVSSARTPRNSLLWAPLLLAAVGIGLGVFPGAIVPAIDGATEAVYGAGAELGKLVAWPGLVPALGWSIASLGIGVSMVLWPSRLDTVLEAVGGIAQRLPSTDGAFRRSVAGLLRFADRASGAIQNGSLPFYIAVIAAIAVVLPSSALLGVDLELAVPPFGLTIEVLLALVVIGSTLGVIFVERRFAAVILLGGAGYGVAGLYAVLGGPDLALTQLLVETLAIALFALVLRHLPARFTKPRSGRLPRVAVALAVGVFVFVGGLIAGGSPTPDPVSDGYLEDSVPKAAGRNVVNVILVDFRGFDTLGEITVLAVAALGVAALVIPVLRRRSRV